MVVDCCHYRLLQYTCLPAFNTPWCQPGLPNGAAKMGPTLVSIQNTYFFNHSEKKLLVLRRAMSSEAALLSDLLAGPSGHPAFTSGHASLSLLSHPVSNSLENSD